MNDDNTPPNGLEPGSDHATAAPETRAGTKPDREPDNARAIAPEDDDPPGVPPPASPPREPDYVVGYGKPPKEHQFKKNQSGNLRGAPRKRRVETADVGAMLSKSVPVKTKRGKKLVHPFEPMLKSLMHRALEENHLSALLEILKYFEAYGAFADPVRVSAGGVIQAPAGVDWHEWLDEMSEFIPDNDDTPAPSQMTPMPEKDTDHDAA